MQNNEYIKNEEKEAEKTLRELLHNLFRVDLEDLDFGIYRIMNFKREEIKNFIDHELIAAVEKEFVNLYKADTKSLEKELDELRQKILNEVSPDAFDKNGNLLPIFEKGDLGKKYKEKLGALNNLKETIQDKAEIFSRVYEFFNRYYMDGDLIPIRRYTRYNDYIVPYNGEEVYLHWANKDQYYVKTTEYFQKYTFRAGSYNVTFRLREAHIDKNNVKGKDKFFILSPENFIEIKGNDVTIFFEYREITIDELEKLGLNEKIKAPTIKEALINDSLQRINNALGEHYDLKRQLNKKYIKSSGEETDKTVLEMHILTYVAKNTKDYFIHKNLKKFFLTELDFYIKNEMLNMEDIERWDEETLRINMRRVRVFKNISTKIIEFLSEIEEFEKMLWEKKKFVLKTEYVITLDKIKEYAGEKFLDGIVDDILNNEKQLREWKELFDVDVKEKKDLIAKMNVEGEKEWKKLPVDTKHFDEEFKWKLVMALSKEHDLDDILDGLLIKSENWQALNLMMEKYRERIKTIYIDPPFNTEQNAIIYKNNYKHSTWLSLMDNRLNLSKFLVKKDVGVHIIAIDSVEEARLYLLLHNIWPDKEKTIISVIHNPSGKMGTNFSVNNEFSIFVHDSGKRVIAFENRESNPDVRDLMNTAKGSSGNYLRETGRNCFYPIYVKNGKIIGFGSVPPDDFHPKRNIIRSDGIIEVYPIDNNGVERKWVLARDTIEKHINELVPQIDPNTGEVRIKRIKTKINYKTVWLKREYSAKKYGTDLLGHILPFTRKMEKLYPKSIYLVKDSIHAGSNEDINSIVLDFFAGSGTTAHAVMLLNKEDGGKRKFILVEMADYFDTVIIPRIKKVAYSFNWKDGKPQDMDGIGVFFKYNTLEQYEDTLNNIIFAEDKERQAKLKEFEDYIFHILEYGTRGSASRLNIDQFKKPFSYKMEILENGIPKTMNVDLVETFNYLIGLNVKKIHLEGVNGRDYIWVIGELRDKSSVVVVWRETEDLDMEKDRKYIMNKMRELAGANPDYIYVNGDSHVPEAIPIETEFMKRMGA